MPNRKYSINVYPLTQWWGFESFLWMQFKVEGAEGLFLPLQPLDEQEPSSGSAHGTEFPVWAAAPR